MLSSNMTISKILVGQGDFLCKIAMNCCKTNQGKSVKKFYNRPSAVTHQIDDIIIALICFVYWKSEIKYQTFYKLRKVMIHVLNKYF